jgi:hypothetical protein
MSAPAGASAAVCDVVLFCSGERNTAAFTALLVTASILADAPLVVDLFMRADCRFTMSVFSTIPQEKLCRCSLPCSDGCEAWTETPCSTTCRHHKDFRACSRASRSDGRAARRRR